VSIFYKIFFSIVILTCIFISCSKDEDKVGCTDVNALNFNSLAVIDDGSCEYLDSVITIWENGQLGFWGNSSIGAFEVKSCYTNITSIFLNPDSTFTIPDTIIDNTVTPPDTTIIPADTSITGDTYLLVNSDTNGRYKLNIELLNKQGATEFKNGELIFNAKLHPDANIQDFEVVINGNNLNSGGLYCNDYLFSDPIIISSTILDTNNFNEISIPLTSFPNRYMNNIDLVFGIQGTNASPNTSLIIIDKIKWEVKQPNN